MLNKTLAQLFLFFYVKTLAQYYKLVHASQFGHFIELTEFFKQH